jgi:hypothetical protein
MFVLIGDTYINTAHIITLLPNDEMVSLGVDYYRRTAGKPYVAVVAYPKCAVAYGVGADEYAQILKCLRTHGGAQ